MTDPGPVSATTDPAAPARPRLAKNFAALMSSQLITWTLATIVSIILPRFIDPSSLGQYRLSVSVWTIGGLAIGAGTSTYLTLHTARDDSRSGELVGTIVVLRAIVFSLVTVVVAGVAVFAGVDRQLALLLAVGALLAFVGSYVDVYGAALAGMEQMTAQARAAIAARVLTTVAVITVLFAGGDIVTVALASVVGGLGAIVILVRAYRRFDTTVVAGWRSRWRSVLRSSRVFLAAGAALVVYQQIDTIVMAALVDPDALGWYTTADTLFSSLLFVPAILMASVLPRLSRLHEADRTAMTALTRRSFSSLMLLGIPIGFGTFVVAPEFSLLLFGEDYRQTGPVLQVFGIVIPLVFGTILLGGIAKASDRQRFWVIVMTVGIVLSVPLDIVLVPWTDSEFGNGAIGGAIAYVVTESMMFAIGLWKVAPEIVERATVLRLAKILLAGGVMLAATWPLREMLFLVPAAVGTVVYVVMILVTHVLTDEERENLAELRYRIAARRRR